jgi:hypothetical protein
MERKELPVSSLDLGSHDLSAISFEEKTAKEAYKLKMQIKELQNKLDEEMEILKKWSGGETKKWGSYRLVIDWRTGSVDYKSIPELKNVNLDQYRKPATETCKLEFLGE